MGLRALIFDADGTLADTEEVHRQAFNQVFREYNTGWVWDAELYRKLLAVNGGKERIRYYLSLFHPSMLQYEYTERLITQMHRDKTQAYTRMLAAGSAPMRPGLMRLLAEAKAKGLRLAIATTTAKVNVTALLRSAIGLRAASWFDVIATNEDVAKRKPAPDIYQVTLEKLGLAPSHCIAFEDSAMGMRAAVAAGLPVVVTPSRYTEGEDFTGALAVLSDLGEPGQPFRQLAGEDMGAQWVDLGLLRRWHAAVYPPEALPTTPLASDEPPHDPFFENFEQDEDEDGEAEVQPRPDEDSGEEFGLGI